MGTRLRIKICCISSADEAHMARDAGADFLGLVGPMPGGPGVLTLAEAHLIAIQIDRKAKPILLSSSETAEAIRADAARVGATHVQVVRHIAPAEAEKLSAMPLTYFQVIHIEGADALEQIPVYGQFCDAFLLDSGRPSDNTLGGTGETHDWSISAEFVRRAEKPTFLAGGLTPQNAMDAIRKVRPYGLDICSGIRTGGKLNPDLLRAFMNAVKAA